MWTFLHLMIKKNNNKTVPVVVVVLQRISNKQEMWRTSSQDNWQDLVMEWTQMNAQEGTWTRMKEKGWDHKQIWSSQNQKNIDDVSNPALILTYNHRQKNKKHRQKPGSASKWCCLSCNNKVFSLPLLCGTSCLWPPPTACSYDRKRVQRRRRRRNVCREVEKKMGGGRGGNVEEEGDRAERSNGNEKQTEQ